MGRQELFNNMGQFYIVTIIFRDPLYSCENMFRNMENLLEVDLSNFDSSQVTFMKFMFSGCTKLRALKCQIWILGKLKGWVLCLVDVFLYLVLNFLMLIVLHLLI